MFCGMGEKTPVKLGGALCSCCAVWLCIAAACCAQGAQPDGGPPLRSHVRLAPSAASPTSTHSATAPRLASRALSKKSAFPKDAAAKPASVDLTNGKLTIQANNSDLGQILRDLARISGMTIDGLTKGPRVFGVYGPGNSGEVLADLLVGSGYNFIMVGDVATGAPRELLLTPQSSRSPALTSGQPGSAAPDGDEESNQPDDEMNPAAQEPAAPDPSITDPSAPGPSATDPSVAEPLGPGAIPPAPSRDSEPDDNKRVQQNLQRLQQMQEQQQQTAPQ